MFKKIMVAIDGSECAGGAAKTACALAEQLRGAEVRLIHVVEDAPSRGEVMRSGMEVKPVLKEKAKARTAPVIEVFEAAGVDHSLKVALGDPADKIVETARDEEMDLIVIGSRGLGSVGSLLLGSVSRRVSQQAACPVMIVKGDD